MMEMATTLALGVIGVAVLMNVYRFVKGPDILDRVLALDTLVINAIALIVIAGIRFASHAVFEAALLFAMVGFVSTVAFCRFLLRGNVLE
jgi:multicomponent K+:H+ antiporter subunit F